MFGWSKIERMGNIIQLFCLVHHFGGVDLFWTNDISKLNDYYFYNPLHNLLCCLDAFLVGTSKKIRMTFS